MENKYRKIAILFLFVLVFSSCDQFEMRGFITGYETADERFEQSMNWNLTHPYQEIVVPKDEYHLFVMGDSHLGSTENFDFFVKEAQRTKASATIMNGDLTTGNVEDFDRFFQHLPSQDSLVSFQLVGNHDLYFDGWKKFYSLFGASSYLFSVKTPTASDLFICLDTGGGTLGIKQMNWLKEVLENERSKYRRCVVFSHNNIFRIQRSFSGNLAVEELYVLMDWFVKYKVDMVVGAHEHRRNIAGLGNTTHVTMDALQDINEDASYLRLNVNKGKILIEFVDI